MHVAGRLRLWCLKKSKILKGKRQFRRKYTFYFSVRFLPYNDDIYVLQEHPAQYCSRGAVCHHDLCFDERVVLDSPVGHRND